jgi:hypothetical protein
LFDSKNNLPLTTKSIELSKTKNSLELFMEQQGMPIVKLGHANSFIKNTKTVFPGE